MFYYWFIFRFLLWLTIRFLLWLTIRFLLWLTIRFFTEVDAAPLQLNGLVLENSFATSEEMQTIIIVHYSQSVYRQLYKIIGMWLYKIIGMLLYKIIGMWFDTEILK
jgi:hypothetical protein